MPWGDVMPDRQISRRLASQLSSEGVDIPFMLKFLDDLNAGKFKGGSAIRIADIPSLPHPDIIDCSSLKEFSAPKERAQETFSSLNLPFNIEDIAEEAGDSLVFSASALKRIGIALYPKAAFGILNGGSATSYVDSKKNFLLCPEIFPLFNEKFAAHAERCRGKPKGVTPAYFNPDGSAGYSFLFLKLRMLLERKADYVHLFGALPPVILPAFQMTSVKTNAETVEHIEQCSAAPDFAAPAKELGCPPVLMHTETQKMMAALTHSSEGEPRGIFDRAYGEADRGIALPGGHGQNFAILAPVYKKLKAMGIRYAWLGNIDNIGYTVDPVLLAVFALSGREAAFETSFKTELDLKGGLLVITDSGKVTCADIGPAVTADQMKEFEQSGKRLLFNCGIGLFDLERLVPALGSIPYKLPLRITDQDKDAGRYAQAEQLTWEIIGLLERPLFFAVKKERRFIAAKMLLENILASLPESFASVPGFAETPLYRLSLEVKKGLCALLESEYGMELSGGAWRLKQGRDAAAVAPFAL